MAESTQSITPARNGQRSGELARRERRWDPFALFDEFQEEMSRFWGRPFGGWPLMRPFQRVGQLQMRWAPRVDVYERDNTLVVKAELPGVKREDVHVELDDGDLVIRGETREEKEVKEEDYRRMERSYGVFYRRLPLPFDVQPDQIQANLTDGVLEVRIPKPAERKSEPKRIPVK